MGGVLMPRVDVRVAIVDSEMVKVAAIAYLTAEKLEEG